MRREGRRLSICSWLKQVALIAWLTTSSFPKGLSEQRLAQSKLEPCKPFSFAAKEVPIRLGNQLQALTAWNFKMQRPFWSRFRGS